jgi:hypothetical protein
VPNSAGQQLDKNWPEMDNLIRNVLIMKLKLQRSATKFKRIVVSEITRRVAIVIRE